jgi:hypothetical protein
MVVYNVPDFSRIAATDIVAPGFNPGNMNAT